MSEKLDTTRLVTRRLVLRPLAPDDAVAVEALCGRDFEVVRWLTSPPWPYEEGSAEAYTRKASAIPPANGAGDFAITLGGVVIGVVAIGVSETLPGEESLPTLGYWVGRPFQGFGYAREAVAAACAWAFETSGTPALAARVFADNARSQGLLNALGFTARGRMTSFARPLGEERESLVMRCEKSAFAWPSAAA